MPSNPCPARRVTASDVARAVGLSRATVGFVLNNTPGQTIPEVTRQRVLVQAERMGYRPHQAARALASGQSRIVLLVLPDWPIEYSLRVHLDEAARALDQAGYSLVTTTPHPGSPALPLWQTLSPDVVMGLVPFEPADLDSIRRSGVTRIIPDEQTAAQTGDAMGFAEGPRRQVEHLLQTGRTRLAFAGSSDPRIRDLVAARRALTSETYRAATKHDLVGDADVDETSAVDLVERWRGVGVDGVIAYNDDVAAMIVGAALRAGIRIPDELAVVGHDDTPLARLFVPALSSVRVDTGGLGRYFAQLALNAMKGSEEPINTPESEVVLIVRESS